MAPVGAAAVSYVTTPHSVSDIVAVVGLFTGMLLAERFPVPVEGMDAGGVTLGFVFAVAGILLFGWQAGVLIAAGSRALAARRGMRAKNTRFSRALRSG